MKKVLQSQFFDSLIKSDFLILKKKSQYTQNKFLLSKNEEFVNLNPVTLLKNLKQFVRLIQFIKNDGVLNLDLKNRQLNTILQMFLKKYNLNIELKTNGLSSKTSNKTKNELLLLLDVLNYKEKHLFKKLIQEQKYLVQSVNSRSSYNNSNIYKIYNDLNDIKKMVFFLCLIQQITK